MTEEMEYISFFHDWYLLAEGRDTDEKRLAFYDAIFRYAFENEVPEKPKRGDSPGVVWAAWDAYVTTHTIINNLKKKIFAGKAGGIAGRGDKKARFGNQNASKTQAPDASKTQADDGKNASKTQDININKDINKDLDREVAIATTTPHKEGETLSSRDGLTVVQAKWYDECPNLPIVDEMCLYALQCKVPRDYIPKFLARMSELGWEYQKRNGNIVRLNKTTFKTALRAFYEADMAGEKKLAGKVSVSTSMKERFKMEGFDASFLDG